MQSQHSQPDHIFLAGGFNYFPGTAKAGAQHKTVSGLQMLLLAALFRDDRAARENVAELPLVIDDAPFARRRHRPRRSSRCGTADRPRSPDLPPGRRVRGRCCRNRW
eukprot:gene7165-8825_t